ncbi:Dihydroorotate dehydrogenase (NAD(+)), electron transfer subunit [hydrothermal vent metagenome]|uniref:Dihydroorotate dehydrogenase (NAD(+)), electron transfer subunit n=1 Tax=hydrothermal vent metagenome TaxID=652676 RepID=A0A3B1DT21_9ZZZZ
MSTTSLPGMVSTALQLQATVIENVLMATNTYRMRLECPEIAEQILPGQFFMIREPHSTNPLLGRPFALFDTYEENGKKMGIDFGYVVVGKMTSLMMTWQQGDKAEIWGPLGNGFPIPTTEHLMMVAGGIGQTPFLAVAQEALGLKQYGLPSRDVFEKPTKVSICYGARSKKHLAGVDLFELPNLAMQIATDDGTEGHHGFVTELLEQSITSDKPPTTVYCCGPELMMKAVAKLCALHHLPCWISLETPMACGFGACFSCVTRVVQDDGTWDYKRTCVEGPVFPAEKLVF